MNIKTVRYTFFSVVVIIVFLSAYTLIGTRGDTEAPLNVENDVPVDGQTITETTAVTVISYNEQEKKMITETITNPITTTISGKTVWTTVEAPYFRVSITGWGRLLNENGEVISSQHLRSSIDNEKAIEDWQIEVRVRIQSNIANWNTGEIKLKVYIQDMTTLDFARISWETDTPPYKGLNPTGDTVEIYDDWRDSVQDALNELGRGPYVAPRPFRFVLSVQCYQIQDKRTGEYIHDPGEKDEVKTEVGFSTTIRYSATAGSIVVNAPVIEEESSGGKGRCMICAND